MSSKTLFALTVIALFFLSSVSAHGHMTDPKIRIAPGDENNGLTITRGPTKVSPCAGLPAGPVQGTFAAGQNINIQWEIGAAHKGQCFVELSTDGEKTFTVLKELPNCADVAGPSFSSAVQLPATPCTNCVLRWRWEASLTGELYLNCADISIAPAKKAKKTRRANKRRSSATDKLVKREIKNFLDEIDM